jgi:Trp operon repressor
MTQVSRRFLDKQTQEYIFQTFISAATKLSSPSLTQSFLQDLLTPTEQIMLAKRLCIAYMLQKGYPQRKISDTLKLSTTTITRVSNILKSQSAGYKKVLNLMLADEKINDFFKKIDSLFDKLSLPPKGNWTNYYQNKRKTEQSKLKPF